MKKKNYVGVSSCLAIALCVIMGVLITGQHLKDSASTGLLLENVEALSEGSENEGNSNWFSNLRTVECEISKVNFGAGFYYKGVWIAAGGTYTYYGSKKRCEREFTINTCNLANETACK